MTDILDQLKIIEQFEASIGDNSQASPPVLARRLIHALDIYTPDFTFIDFGSGNGNVLRIAREFPFKLVIGVEDSLEIYLEANKNLSGLEGVANVLCDAANYELPPGNLVAYFYNPFPQYTMSVVADKLCWDDTEREVYVLYVNPVQKEVFDGWLGIERSMFHQTYYLSAKRPDR